MRVLGIETSCDDTCAAVVEGGRILSSVVSSQHDFHHAYGGVVPEIAARHHSRLITPVISHALARADTTWDELGALAVTTCPGLIGALVVGVAVAKGISLAQGIPIVPVNHLMAHVHTTFLAAPDVEVPHVCLLVSGGHTLLFLVTGPRHAAVMGTTLDDAAGEALDKAAHLLGLGYPGGPAIDAAAAEGDPAAVRFPRPVADRHGLDFSFSGLKTALAVHLRRHGAPRTTQETSDLSASYLEAVVDVLVHKTLLAVELAGVRTVALTGGVAANRRLRERMAQECRARDLRVVIPPRELCTDNAAMVAALGEEMFEEGADRGMACDASATVSMPRWDEPGGEPWLVARADG